MADSTVSLYPQFMAQVGSGTGGGTIIVGGLEVDVVEQLLAEIEGDLLVEDISEILVPVDLSDLTVEVVEEHDVGIEVCP